MHLFMFLNLIILIRGTMLQSMLTQYRKVAVQKPQVPKRGWILTLSLPHVLFQYGWNILVETQNNIISMLTRVSSVSGSAVNLLLITPEKAIKLVVNDYLRYKFTDKKWVLSWRTAITVTLYVANDMYKYLPLLIVLLQKVITFTKKLIHLVALILWLTWRKSVQFFVVVEMRHAYINKDLMLGYSKERCVT